MAKFTNPLNNIRGASPCPANWDEIAGDERKRFCGQCKLNVYNLSGMTRSEAEKLLINSEGRLCVRFYRRADGTVLTKDCRVGWRAFKRRVWRTATAAFSFVVGLFGGLGFGGAFAESKQTTMGRMALPVIPITREIPVTTMGAIAVQPQAQEQEPQWRLGKAEVGMLSNTAAQPKKSKNKVKNVY